MSKSKSKPADQHENEPENENQEVPERELPLKSNGKVNAAELVRRARAEGISNPTEGSKWIAAHYGFEVAPKIFSAAIAQIRRAEEKRDGQDRPVQARQPTTTSTAAANRYSIPPTFGKDVVLLRALLDDQDADANALKTLIHDIGYLIDQYGSEQLGELIDAFE